MKRILFIINTLGSGGAQRQMVELAIGYKQRGYDVLILEYYRKFSNYYEDYLAAHDVPIDDIEESNYLKRIWKFCRYIREYHPDVIIAFLEVSSFIAEMSSIMSHKWKLIVGERSADPAKKTSKRLRFFLHCHRFADAVVANSNANIDIIREVAPELPESKFHVIYNILDQTKFTIDPQFKFCTDKKRKLLIASSHRYLKNLNGLIEAVRLLPEDLQKQLTIDWYGHSKLDDSLIVNTKKVQDYGFEDIFHFHKDTLEIYEYMRQADAVGLFSYFEGFPNAVCEGMFLAKPIIATAVSDIPLMLHEDENAFLCQAESPQTIANALIKFIQSSPEQLEEMGQRNRKIAEHLFDKKTILDQYEALFT